MSFADRARDVVRDFIRTVVLLDDQWPEVAHSGSTSLEPLPMDEIDETGQVSTDEGDDAPAPSESLSPNNMLREVEAAFVGQGMAFTGLRYEASKREIAQRLSTRAEVLILDWNLVGNDNGAEVIDILRNLRDKSSGPRFVIIYTGQTGSADVQDQLAKAFGMVEQPKGSENFRAGSFVFSVRSKPNHGAAGDATPYGDLAKQAVTALLNEHSGLLDLCLIELTARHQAQLGAMLSRFGKELDIALICEWADRNSPIYGEGESLKELILDEWSSRLRSGAGEAFRIMSQEGFHEFLKQRQQLVPTRQPDEDDKVYRAKVREGLKSMRGYLKDKQQILLDEFIDGNRVVEAGADYEKFLQSPHEQWLPFRVNQPSGGKVLGDCAHWRQAIFKAKLGVSDIETAMKRLQCVFSQQVVRPRQLTQGTVLRRQEQDYFICITPLCDAARPSEKVSNTFLFVRAFVEESGRGSLEEGTYVVVEDRSSRNTPGQVLELFVNPNPPVALVIERGLLEFEGKEVKSLSATPWSPAGDSSSAADPPGAKLAIELQFVAQLRKDRALLVATAAFKALQRIGVDNVEHLRRK